MCMREMFVLERDVGIRELCIRGMYVLISVLQRYSGHAPILTMEN